MLPGERSAVPAKRAAFMKFWGSFKTDSLVIGVPAGCAVVVCWCAVGCVCITVAVLAN